MKVGFQNFKRFGTYLLVLLKMNSVSCSFTRL